MAFEGLDGVGSVSAERQISCFLSSGREVMRELFREESEAVAGGNPVVIGVVAGAAVGAYSTWHGGGNAGQIAAGAILGGVSGLYGGLGMWGSSITVGAFGSFAGGGGRITHMLR